MRRCLTQMSSQHREPGFFELHSKTATRIIKMKKISVDRIKSPLKDFKDWYICPYCNHILGEAVQAACGHRYCRSCAIELCERYIE